MPIDPETYQRFLLAEARAKQLGLSLSEVLDRAQLLLTDARRRSIEEEALSQLYLRLDRQAPHKLMAWKYNRESGTAAEMFDAMSDWIRLVINKWSTRTLEEL